MGPDPVTIAVATDAAYLPWTATLLRSVLDAGRGDQHDLHVVHNGIRPSDQGRLSAMVDASSSTLTFHHIDADAVDGLPTTEAFGAVVWLRLHIPELLRDRSRAIYLDADTFVISSLRALFNSALEGLPLGAVANVVEPAYRPHVRSLGLEYPGGLFNSGVLLMDLEQWRAEGAAEAVRARARTAARDDVNWPDQESLNLVFAGRWAPLHPRWNAQNSFWLWPEWAEEVFGASAVREAKTAPVVRHFEGPSVSKPWHYLCPYPGRRRYRATLARTPWASTPVEDRTAATRAIRFMPNRLRLPAYRRLLAWRVRHPR